MSSESWQVFPEPVDPARTLGEAEQQRIQRAADKGCWWVGVAVFFLLYPLIGFLVVSIAPEGLHQYVAWVAGGVALLASLGITVATMKNRERRMVRAALEEGTVEKAARRVRDAQRLEATLSSLLERSEDLASSLPGHLQQASLAIERAKREYEDNAFGPFWDAVEEAGSHLAAFSGAVRRIQSNAEAYYRSLEHRDHTFPRFGIRPEDLPDPRPLMRALQSLIRKGQTDPHFAVILEHRKTREVLIAGFRTLHEALRDLEGTVVASVSEFADTFRSQTARIVEEQIESRRVSERGMKRAAEKIDELRRDLRR